MFEAFEMYIYSRGRDDNKLCHDRFVLGFFNRHLTPSGMYLIEWFIPEKRTVPQDRPPPRV